MSGYRNDWPAISRMPLFRNFSDDEIVSALACLSGRIETFERKQTLFRADDVLHTAGLVLEGQVLLGKESESGDRIIFSEAEAGDLIGETALRQSDEESGFDAIAGTDCRVLFVRIDSIVSQDRGTCPLRARVIENMFRLLLENNRGVYRKLDLVSQRSLRDRVLYYLTLQARKNNASSFDIPFSRGDLADYLTVDRSALSRELRRMAKDGLIAFTGRRFELLAGFDADDAPAGATARKAARTS